MRTNHITNSVNSTNLLNPQQRTASRSSFFNPPGIQTYFSVPWCDFVNTSVNNPLPKVRSFPSAFVNQDFSDWNDAYSRNDYGTILRSRKLFWLTFCKEVNNRVCGDFSVSDKGGDLTISGGKVKSIENTVNNIRSFFLRSFEEKRTIPFVLVENYTQLHIGEKQKIINWNDWFNDKDNNIGFATDFFRYVEPFVGDLARCLGANFLKKITSQEIDYGKIRSRQTKQIKYFEIGWAEESYYVYPIEKINIPPRDSSSDNFYSMYLNGVFCDLKFVTKEGIVLNVHSLIILSQGGEVMQKILTSNMKDSIQKVIEFKEFSLNTVKAFVDFIYLGEKGVSVNSLKERNLDISKLFEMAHTYQFMPLVDHCSNLITLFWDKNDLVSLKAMAKRYKNAHLKKLYEHFVTKKLLNIIVSSFADVKDSE